MIAYFPSGIIADRYSARKLMSASLIATSFGGIWMAFIPGFWGLTMLFAYWGFTTILLFWSAMMRTTREWGGKFAQGRAFGLLDGGRGLVSALAATLAVYLLASFLPDVNAGITLANRQKALQSVILFYSVLGFAASILVWFSIPDSKLDRSDSEMIRGIKEVLSNRSVWLQAIVVVCAYCGYRGLDFYSLYCVEVLGMDEVSAARFMSNATYLRAIGAIGAGFLADRLSSRLVISGTFIVLLLCFVFLYIITPLNLSALLIFGNLVITILAVYALRGIYFALFEEIKVPLIRTGTTVGLISLVGYTPDVFFNSIAGRIIDAAPGSEGYSNFFLFLGVFALLGIGAILLLFLPSNSTFKKQ
jgi:sugar phosphate permease